jgi:hypothetical protein
MDPKDAALIIEAVAGLAVAVGVAALLIMLGTAAGRLTDIFRRSE